ncbi:hypothetical protein KH5_12200 [Urechidicola sp. KH5]
MNRIVLNLFLTFTFASSFAQNTQNFTRQFQTSSGIYGYVEVLTSPTGFGTLAIQQSKTVVEGINNFSGNSLSEYGVSFPFNCSNCFFYADGTVSMQIRDVIGRSSGTFSKGGTINLNSGINRFIDWAPSVKEQHNEALSKYREGNYWERNGRVETLNIYSVKGGDFGTVSNALRQYNADQNQQSVSNSQTQNSSQTIGNISSVSRNSSNNSTSTVSNNNGVMYDSNGLPTTPEIEAQKARSQAKYEQQMERIQYATQALTALGNMLEQNRQNRLAFEREQARKKQMEEERKNQFDFQAEKYRGQFKAVISARQAFLEQPKLKSVLNQDGTGFKPLYIYFAYIPKDYDYYYENVRYPNTMKFKINEEVNVQFSQVFAFFPYSNGQYPFIEEIKNKILAEYFGRKANDYYTVFFNWEKSVEAVTNSLRSNLDKAVSTHYFSQAIPPKSNQITFLNDKINSEQSKDYWTGEKVKTKSGEKTDYWSTDKKKKNKKKKTDYWNNNN